MAFGNGGSHIGFCHIWRQPSCQHGFPSCKMLFTSNNKIKHLADKLSKIWMSRGGSRFPPICGNLLTPFDVLFSLDKQEIRQLCLTSHLFQMLQVTCLLVYKYISSVTQGYKNRNIPNGICRQEYITYSLGPTCRRGMVLKLSSAC